MELITALLTKFDTVLTDDATLKAAMGGTVHLYPEWAMDDATWPFLVHSIDLRSTEVFPILQGTYILNVWSDTDDAAEVLAIRDRIITLLDQQDYDIDDGEDPPTEIITGCRIWLQTDGFIAEQGIWHRAMQFNIRLYRRAEVNNILTR